MLAPPPPPSGPISSGPSIPSGPISSGPISSGPSISYGRPNIFIGAPPVIYGAPTYGVYDAPVISYSYSFFDIFWFMFIIIFIIIIISAMASGSSSSNSGTLLSNGVSFPSTGNLYVTNNTGKQLTAVTLFTNNQQTYYIKNQNGTNIFDNNTSFVIPVQSGSMIYASDSSNKIYGIAYSNVNNTLQMSAFGNGNVSNPFITYSTINPLNNTTTPINNVITKLTNPITPPNSKSLLSNMTFPTSLVVSNESNTTILCSLFNNNTIGTVESQVYISSGNASSLSLGNISPGGFAFIMATTTDKMESGIIVFNVNGLTFVQVLFGEALFPTIKLFVPMGYSLPIFKHIEESYNELQEPIKKSLVLYVFHEFNDRVEYFIQHGCFESNAVDFLFICNDPSFPIKEKVPSYAKTINRENKGFDFGGWSDALITHGYKDQPYETYIFVNSSVKGPFQDKEDKSKWTERFENGLNEDVKLFGVTINCAVIEKPIDPIENAHIQSFVYSMRQPMLHTLINEGIFTNVYIDNFHECIRKQEVGLSRTVLKHGGNLGVTHAYYDGVDWLFRNTTPDDFKKPFLGDIMWHREYENGFLKLNELVFVKANRIHV